MEVLEILINNYLNLKVEDVFEEVFSDKVIEEFILDLERDRLFTFGEDSKGKTLGQYAISTKIRKERQGLPSGHITLYDTGAFYDSFSLTLTADGFVLDADAQKEGTNLFERYGTDILGLTDEDIEKFIAFGMDKMQSIILSKLFEGI